MKQKFISESLSFAEKHGISLARLSTIMNCGGNFFKRLQGGSNCTIDTLERFLKVFKDPAAWEAAKVADRARRSMKPPSHQDTES